MLNISQRTGDYFSEVVDKHGGTIIKICRLYLKNSADAEDVFQSVFLKLIEKQPEFHDDEHEKAWLIRVAINKCKDHLKSYWWKNIISIEDYDGAREMDEYSEVFQAVAKLSSKYKILIYMYYYEGYSTVEIAKMLNINEATIRTRLKRAREQLKHQLKGDDFRE
jgi:RNA polymerase sigma factor (sigma-70 family)